MYTFSIDLNNDKVLKKKKTMTKFKNIALAKTFVLINTFIRSTSNTFKINMGDYHGTSRT